MTSDRNRATLILVAGMLITGTANTILNKFQDRQCVGNCDDPDFTKRHHFEQPLWQTLNMFIGEFSCIIVYLYTRYFSQTTTPLFDSSRNNSSGETFLDEGEIPRFNSEDTDNPIFLNHAPPTEVLAGKKMLLMWIPCFFDICGTTLMNVGLIYTSASVYQMLRGSIVLFVGLFSVFFLRRKLFLYQWVALFSIVSGVAIVGASSIFRSTPQVPTNPEVNALFGISESLLGVLMVLIAQMFSASQFVAEEKILSRYHLEPADGVWLEGLFGMISVGTAMPFLHYFFGRSHPGGYFDVSNGWHEISSYPMVWITGVFIAISIAFFNFFGLSVTRTLSATSRSTIDTSRTLFIWMVSLVLGWETFSILQVIGFSFLVYGTFLFNGVVAPPKCLVEEESPEQRHLL